MTTDARLSCGFPQHPKTRKVVRRLGKAAAYDLVTLILWVAQNRSDGDLRGLSDEDIEIAADFDGDEGAFVGALADVGFLEGEPGARRMHDWSEHQPWAANAGARSDKARWAAICRRHGRAEAARQMPEYAAQLAEQDGSGEADPGAHEAGRGHAGGGTQASHASASSSESSASSRHEAEHDSASSSPGGESSTAPSPTPTPNPSPSPEDEQQGRAEGRDGAEGAPDIPPAEPGRRDKPNRYADDIQRIFVHWQQVMGHPQAKLDRKREGRIRDRLKDGYTAEDLMRAVDGCTKSPHNMGENDRSTRYDDIELICRDASRVDKFLRLAGGPDMTGMRSATRQTATAAQEWLGEVSDAH